MRTVTAYHPNRTYGGGSKSHDTHKRPRSAFHSLQRNLDYLFTFEQFAELNIPQTSNFLKGRFSGMKQKLRCYQGMGKDNKIRFIKEAA